MNNQRREISRIDRILRKLAEAHYPDLLANYWAEQNEDKRIRTYSRQFAQVGVVLVAGSIPDEYTLNPQIKARVVGQWIRPYRKLYQLLTQRLFSNMPALHQFESRYADTLDPPIVILRGEATAVLHWVAGCINPYVDNRQQYKSATRAEFYSIMSMILDALEAGSGQLRTELITAGITFLEEMINSPVNHISLTRFDDEVVKLLGLTQAGRKSPKPPPAGMPEKEVAPPAPPNDTPETHIPFDTSLDYVEDSTPTATAEMFRYEVNTDTGPLPPLPPIPNPKKDKNDKS